MATSRGQPGKGCVQARQYADLAFSLACRWRNIKWMKLIGKEKILSFDFSSQLCAGRPTRSAGKCWRGGGRAGGQVAKLAFRLFAPIVDIFSNRCSTESQPGARWTAVDQLIALLGGDEGSGDQNDNEEKRSTRRG